MKSLKKEIEDYVSNNPIRFHMPGHSGGDLMDRDFQKLASNDITELSFSDNLQFPTSSILKMEKNLANIYSCNTSLVLTTGSTTGIQIAALLARERGGKIMICGEPHKSILSAIELFKLQPVDYNNKDLENVDAIYITTPNYLGKVYTDVEEIILAAQAKGILTIVDEAHAAHFQMSTLFPKSYSGIADIVITSLHKTLPVLTGGAVINIKDAKIAKRCLVYRQRLHTTSPSYLILMSIDKFIEEREKYLLIYDDMKRIIDESLQRATKLKLAHYDDFTRLFVDAGKMDVKSVESYLRQNNIYAEGIIDNKIVFIVTPFNYRHLDYLVEILNSYQEDYKRFDNEQTDYLLYNNSVTVNLNDAVGKKSLLDVGIYPPGRILIFAGEEITKEAVEQLKAAPTTFGVIGDTILVEGEE